MTLPQTLIIVALLQAGVIISPGSDYALVLRTVSKHGKIAGVMTALGLGAGALLLVVLAIFGLSALLATVPSLGLVIRYAGAVWLLYQAVISFFPRSVKSNTKKTGSFLAGVINHAINIDMAIFYIAVITQLNRGNVSQSLQYLLAVEMATFTALWFIFIASVTSRIPQSERILNLPIVRVVIGGLFVFSAVSLILFGSALGK